MHEKGCDAAEARHHEQSLQLNIILLLTTLGYRTPAGAARGVIPGTVEEYERCELIGQAARVDQPARIAQNVFLLLVDFFLVAIPSRTVLVLFSHRAPKSDVRHRAVCYIKNYLVLHTSSSRLVDPLLFQSHSTTLRAA